MSLDESKSESSSSANQPLDTIEKEDGGNDAANGKDSYAVSNKRVIQNTVNGECLKDENSPQKKKPRQEEEDQQQQQEEQEDAVAKARKVLEMFRKEFGDDDDDVVKPAIQTLESAKDEKAADPGDQANQRFQKRKPTILQDDDPCLL